MNNPILTNTDMLKIKNMKVDGFKVAEVPITYYKNTSLERAIDRLFVEVDRAHRDGANILILTDRGVDENHVPIPSLLAVSAVHQYLVKTKKRTSRGHHSGDPVNQEKYIILQHCWAMAPVPSTRIWLMDTIHELIDSKMLDKDYYAAVDDYNACSASRYCKDCIQDGYFYHPVLSWDLRSLRPSVSAKK